MRILYLNPSGQLGGAERSLLDVLASLRAAKPDWSLRLVVGEQGPLVGVAKALGVAAQIVPFPVRLARLGDAGAGVAGGQQVPLAVLLWRCVAASAGVGVYMRTLRRAIGESAPDLIHTNGFKMHLLAIWARANGTPVVWHIHDYVRCRPVMARLLRRHAPCCAVAVVNSQSVASDLRALCGSRLKVTAVYNGIDLNRFCPTGLRLDLDALSGLAPAGEGTVRVGLVGTLARWKGHRVFLRALSLLPPSLPVRGYVVGGNIYQTDGSQSTLEELRGLAARLGIAHRVGFTGFVPEPPAALRALDLVVHASTNPEPFGLVIVEAMACGRAVISSATGGAGEIIQDGRNALAHPAGDAAALAERIARLVLDRDLCARLARAGREIAERHFDRQRLASDLIPIYQSAHSPQHQSVHSPQHECAS